LKRKEFVRERFLSDHGKFRVSNKVECLFEIFLITNYIDKHMIKGKLACKL